MSSVLLTSGDVKNYAALGAAGIPVYTVAPQIRGTIRRVLGREAADMLAIPQPNETGTRLDWYAPVSGPVVPWSAATEAEREQARSRLAWLRERLGQGAASGGGGRDAETFRRQLPHVASIPSDDHVFLVGGRPVLTFWGFAPSPTPVMPAIAPPVIAAAPPPVTPDPPARPRRRALLALPLLALLALLPFLFGWWTDLACTAGIGGSSPVERVVVMLDTSRSMNRPLRPPPQDDGLIARIEAWGMHKADVWGITAAAHWLGLMKSDEPRNRLDAAKDSLKAMLDDLPRQTEVGLVTFGSCGKAESHGLHRTEAWDQLRKTVDGIHWDSGTPLAEGLLLSAQMVDGVTDPAVIVVVSDGAESCFGDPCGVARTLHESKPLLRVNVVDITGDGAASCLAERTGGIVFDGTKDDDFEGLVTQATRFTPCS